MEPPHTASLFLTPTFSFSFVCKHSQHHRSHPILLTAPKDRSPLCPHLPRQALSLPSAGRLLVAFCCAGGGQSRQPALGSRAKPSFVNQPRSTLTPLRAALVIFRHRWEMPGLSHLRRFQSFLLSPVHHAESGRLLGCWMLAPIGLCKPKGGRAKAGGSQLSTPSAKQSLLT